jgi:hypothetical protein
VFGRVKLEAPRLKRFAFGGNQFPEQKFFNVYEKIQYGKLR